MKKTFKTNQQTLERTQIFVIYNTWASRQLGRQLNSQPISNNNEDIRRMKEEKRGESETASFRLEMEKEELLKISIRGIKKIITEVFNANEAHFCDCC